MTTRYTAFVFLYLCILILGCKKNDAAQPDTGYITATYVGELYKTVWSDPIPPNTNSISSYDSASTQISLYPIRQSGYAQAGDSVKVLASGLGSAFNGTWFYYTNYNNYGKDTASYWGPASGTGISTVVRYYNPDRITLWVSYGGLGAGTYYSFSGKRQ